MRRIFTPEMLFLIGSVQAVTPYLFWMGEGSDLNYIFSMSWGPAVIYVVGFLCFWLGASFVNKSQKTTQAPFSYIDRIPAGRLFYANVTLATLLAYQSVQLTRVYGTIPLLAFLSGDLDVNDANDSLESSALGQMALLQITLLLLNAVLTLTVLKRLRQNSFRPFSLDLWIPATLVVIGFTMGGKRQGLFMVAFFTFTAFVLVGNGLLNRLMSKFLIRGRSMRMMVYVVAPLCGLVFFQLLGMARSGREATLGLRESLFYLELPLINLEYQYELVGFGPDTFAPQGLLRGLLPRRIQEQLFGDGASFDWPLKLEPTASSGFFGELHWHTGLAGVCLFAVLSGFVSRYCFQHASKSLWALLCYCQIVWTLVSCHSYNHFLNLVFIPLPALCYMALSVILRLNFGSKNVGYQKLAKVQPPLQLQSGRS